MPSDGRTLVPPLKMQGIKTKLVPWIRENLRLPDGAVWLEPFMGTGAVGFNLAPREAVFADINPHVVAFYDGLKSGAISPGGVRTFLEREGRRLEEGDGSYWLAARDRFNEFHDPLDFLFLDRSCFNGLVRFSAGRRFNSPYCHRPKRFSKAYVTKIANQAAWAAGRIHANAWTFLCQDFGATLAMADSGCFAYCDPPYAGRNADYYGGWSAEEEMRLRRSLDACGAGWLVSTWERSGDRVNPLLDSVWKGCPRTVRNHFYHVGGKLENRRPVVEALLSKPLP